MSEFELEGGYAVHETDISLEEKEIAVMEILKELPSEGPNYVAFSGGKRSLVLLHLMRRHLGGDLTVLHINTGLEFQEAANYIDKMRRLWGLNLIQLHADDSSLEDREECCRLLKISPIIKFLEDNRLKCLCVGSSKYSNRADWNALESDELKVLKPISDFTEDDVWNYIHKNNITYCSLYKMGFKSVDCEPCSVKEELQEEHYDAESERKIRDSLRKLGYL